MVFDTKTKLPRWVWQLIAGVVGSALFFLAATLLFRSEVKKRTKQLSTTNRQLNAQIEERKKTEEELRKFAHIVEASCDAMALIDKEHRHILANSVYLRKIAAVDTDIAGVAVQDLLGRDFFDNELKESVLACLQGRVVHVQTMLRKEQGRTSYWSITLSPYYLNNDEIAGYVIDIRDVTGQIEIQNRLENAQKMEAIGLLARGVAHDLNNILSGLVSYPDMLLIGRAADDPMTKPLQTIKKSGERAAAIVQDLLTLARRNIGSAVHLQQIVMNLFSNALEAMPGGGQVTLATENRYLDKEYIGYECVPAGEYTLLSIDDTGVGMSSLEIKRIFEPFYTNKILGRSGTGLGMAVVWGAIKDHKGFIDILSEPGKGTLFTMYFPISREALPEKKEAVLQSFMGKGEKILAVDDMEEQRILAVQILHLLGYVVDVASSGEEAVKRCRDGAFDLIILDMIMPNGMDGFATYERIKTFRNVKNAIIVSGFSDSRNVQKAQEYGAGMYLKKPYTITSLAQAVSHELAADTGRNTNLPPDTD
jgi:two-component system, cell cycle sensor histidine kinase and response regulator CckA